MKKRLLLLLFLITGLTNAQEKIKATTIFAVKGIMYVNAQQTIVENEITNTDIEFLVRTHPNQILDTFFYGNSKDFFVLLENLEKSFDEEPNVTIPIGNLTVTTIVKKGEKLIRLSLQNRVATRDFKIRRIEKIKKQTENWFRKSNVSYN